MKESDNTKKYSVIREEQMKLLQKLTQTDDEFIRSQINKELRSNVEKMLLLINK